MNVDAANREPLLPFAPEIVLPTVRGLAAVGLRGPARTRDPSLRFVGPEWLGLVQPRRDWPRWLRGHTRVLDERIAHGEVTASAVRHRSHNRNTLRYVDRHTSGQRSCSPFPSADWVE